MTTTCSIIDTIHAPLVTTHAQAFAEVRAELDAIPDAQLRVINVDIPHVAETALGAAARIERLLPRLAELPNLDLRQVQRLRLYAGALLHAHIMTMEPTEEDPRLRTMLAEASSLRSDLLALAEALGHLGLVSAEHVAEIRGGQGHRNTANDLCALATLYDAVWPRLGSKIPITRAMVDRAAILGAELHEALGDRRLAADPLVSNDDDPRRLRSQAFTALMRAYEVCRRGVSFLRWDHGDAEHFAPSLYPPRRRRARPIDELDEPADQEPAPTPSPRRPSAVDTLTGI